jgi:hypothetical protein
MSTPTGVPDAKKQHTHTKEFDFQDTNVLVFIWHVYIVCSMTVGM